MIDTKNYGDTIMINTRNATDVISHESEPISRDEIKREFSTGDISKIEQDRVFEKLETALEKRKKILEAKMQTC